MRQAKIKHEKRKAYEAQLLREEGKARSKMPPQAVPMKHDQHTQAIGRHHPGERPYQQPSKVKVEAGGDQHSRHHKEHTFTSDRDKRHKLPLKVLEKVAADNHIKLKDHQALLHPFMGRSPLGTPIARNTTPRLVVHPSRQREWKSGRLLTHQKFGQAVAINLTQTLNDYIAPQRCRSINSRKSLWEVNMIQHHLCCTKCSSCRKRLKPREMKTKD